VYPIVRSIPRFVDSDAYVRSFSAQWNIFSRTQLNFAENHDTFASRTGFDLDKLRGKLVLDAGCGMGRFLDVVSRESSAMVVGFDLSLAVDSAYANFGSRRNVHIVQADIMGLPFRRDSFDVIYSIGVLHHTSDPEAAFARLVTILKRNGEIALWVYSTPRRPPLSDFYRIFTSRMPWSLVLAISRLMIKSYRANSLSGYVQAILPISQLTDPEQRLLDTFDWYSPRYQHKYRTSDVVAWFRRAGLKDLRVLATPVSISGIKV
jgi:SAM-dependent methyltransferase